MYASFGQCPLGNVTLVNQQQVNNFLATYPNCTTITGNLIIGHNNNTYNSTDITDLSPLQGITNVTGIVMVKRNNGLAQVNLNSLVSVGGLSIDQESALNTISLQNLTTVGSLGLSFTSNSANSLLGLENLTSIAGGLNFNGVSLNTAFPAFESLTSVGNLTFTNTSKNSVPAFANLNTVTTNIHFQNNPSLTQIAGFGNLNSLGGFLRIENNTQLHTVSFSGSNIGAMGGYLQVLSNANLATLNFGNITAVGGYLTIANVAASTILGLNVSSVGSYVDIKNSSTSTISGLNLNSVGGSVNISATGLTSLSVIKNISSIPGNFTCNNNNFLTTISGFANLTSITGNLHIQNNPVLTQISGFSSLNTLGGYLRMVTNNALNTLSFSGSNIGNLGGELHIQGNGNLSTVHLGGITSVEGNLYLQHLLNINSIMGFQPTTIGGNLTISTTGLTSLSAFQNLTSINGFVSIQYNNALTSVSGLSALTSISGYLAINNNNSLTSLVGLNNLTSGITGLYIQNNPNLETCELSNLCSYLSNPVETHPRTISGNKTGGNCVNQAAVLALCTAPCVIPTDISLTNLTINSANLNWIGSGPSFDIEWGLANFTQGNGTIVNNIASNTHLLSGLNSGTSYKFYVRKSCGEVNKSSWAGPFSFSTLSPCPAGNFTLTTQEQVNNFLINNPSCTTINGNLVIGYLGITYGNTNITDLSPLQAITSVSGNLIIRRNYNLTQINLNALTSVGGDLIIDQENALTSVSLTGLTSVTGNIQISQSSSLTSISGLQNLVSVGGGVKFDRVSLATGFPTFSGLMSVGGNLSFHFINGLTSITGFQNLESIGGNIDIGTSTLTSFTGFNSLTSLGGISVQSNQSPLINFSLLGTAPCSVTGNIHFQSNNAAISTMRLGNITTVGGYLRFFNISATSITGFNPTSLGGGLHIQNGQLSNLSNFSNLTSITGNLHIQNTPLTTLSHLSNLTSVGGYFHLQRIMPLTSLSELSNLTSVAGYVQVSHNPVLTSLTGLGNINSGITNLTIQNNLNLSTCELANFCTYLSNSENPRAVFGNGVNCATDAAIMAICTPPCDEPMDFSVVNLTANTAELGWSGTTTMVDLEWGIAGFTLGNGTTVNEISGMSYSLSNLNPNTEYQFYVRQNCDVNQSNWAGPFVFSTSGYCISVPHISSGSFGIYINSFTTIGGATNIANTSSGFSSGGYGDFSETFSASQHIAETLSFTAVPGTTAYPKGLRIWIDWNNNGVFDVSEVVYNSGSTQTGSISGSFVIPNIAEGNYRMRIITKYNSNSIDSCGTLFYGEAEDYTFTVLPALPCTSPTGLMVANLTTNSINLNWNSVANAQNYNWIVIEAGTNPNTATPIASGTSAVTTVVATGLSSEQTYDVYVKSDCGTIDGQSSWSASVSFTTLGNPLRYVKSVASGTGDGSSWVNASDDLQKMINGASTEQVWVAGGTYKPKRAANNMNSVDAGNRENAFVLKNNVKVYGGFAGTETDLSQRITTDTANISVLSGDLNSDNAIGNQDAYHVVISAGNLGIALIDGFTITGGNANGSGTISVNGRSISKAHAGGLHINNSPTTFNNLKVTHNNGQYGGGIFLASSSAFINNSVINNNTSQSGAGIKFDNSAVSLTNLVVTGNLAGTFGGGIDIYGTPSPILTNVTVSGNSAPTGGGICTNYSSPIISNSIVWGNNSGLTNLTPAYVVTYSNSLVEGVTTTSNGNIEATIDPLFAEMPNFDTAPFSGGNYNLQICSPVINKGNNTPIAGTSIDANGNTRQFNGIVDLGAYEVQENVTAPTNLAAYNLYSNTVSLGWESEGTLFDLEWGIAGFTQGNGTLVNQLTQNTYTLTTTTSTNYEFYVRENCGGNNSNWSGPFTFTPTLEDCPVGYLAFTSQAQIDAFVSYNCNVITHHLVIFGNDITNLAPLANIVKVEGNFYIHDNPLLTSLNGLQNIKSIGGYIRIFNNPLLASIASLNLTEQNGVLNGYLIIEKNPALTSLNGLGSITEIKNQLRIVDNSQLADISALSGLTGIGTSTSLSITHRSAILSNLAISSLEAFSNVTVIPTDLNVSDCPNLTSLQGLHNITSVGGYLRIQNNNLITSLSGLAGLTNVGGYINVNGTSINSISHLSNLSGQLNGHLTIENTALTSLDGLQNFTAIDGVLLIKNNPNLTSVAALANLDPNSITSLTVILNASLSDCSINSFCSYLASDIATHPRYIANNTGSCLNTSVAITACPSPIVCPTGNIVLSSQAQIDNFIIQYPNCTEITGQLRIDGGNNITNLEGLSNIQTITGGFIIWANHGLTSLEGLNNLQTVGSTLTIYNNKNLANLDALSSLTTVGAHLHIQHNKSLLNVDGLSSLVNFAGEIRVENNLVLTNINGLSGLSGNVLSLHIRENEALTNIDALDALTQIGYLYVLDNAALENLNGLSSLTKAVGSISINNNAVLEDISALSGLDTNFIFGAPVGYNSGTGVQIINNPMLSVCDLPNFCTYLTGPKQRTISGNLANCLNEQAFISSCQSCDLPTNPMLVSAVAYSASFSWDAVSESNSYNWIIIANDADPNTATPLFSGTTTDITVTVSDLNSETDYDFYVKNNCNNGVSTWSSRVDFNTEIICPSGNVYLLSQAQINAFPTTYAGCGTISGNLYIGYPSPYNYGTDITDLTPLQSITQVSGSMVVRNNPSLVTLNGLNSITQVAGSLTVENNSALTSIAGLSGITSTGDFLQIAFNPSLGSLSGLQNVTTVGNHLTIFGNHALINLTGLDGVTSTGNYINLGYNLGLQSLTGLGNLENLGGSLDVRHNASLTSLSGLNNLVTVGSDLRIWDNAILTNLNALTTVTSINGYLHLQENPELTDISGLQNINHNTIGGSLGLYIQNNAKLSMCSTLDNFCEYLSLGGLATISGNATDCDTRANVLNACPTIWNGNNWNLGQPTANRNAIIKGNLTLVSGLDTKNLTVKSGILTVSSNVSLTINGSLTNDAAASNVVVENGANLLQTLDVQNQGSITVKRNSFPLYRQDYTLWSAPVSNQNLRGFSAQTLFSRFYSYNTALGTGGEYVQELFTTADVANKQFETGKGYLIRMPNNWTEFVNQSIPGTPYLGSFKGTPNNGTLSIPISNANVGYNLIGNPYPSSISISDFFDGNPGIDRTLYFWRKRNDNVGSGYATYNMFGLVSSQSEVNGLDLQNGIGTGQGFLIKTNGATTVNFNNSMRNAAQNNILLRSGIQNEQHRMWLNLSNALTLVSQTLLGYGSGATQNVDSGLDALYFNDSPVALTSLIENQEYAIQARSLPFDLNDSVPLGFKSDVAGTYSIALSQFDGLFESDQNIFLKDNFSGQFHNLKEANYSFTTNPGTFNDRFSIVYQTTTLGSADFEANSVLVYKQNETLHINAGTTIMQKVELFDIQGRLLYTLDGLNTSVTEINHLNFTNQVLILKIMTVENKVISKKVLF